MQMATNKTLIIYERIKYDQKPNLKRWRLPVLYKRDMNGKVSTWQVGFNGKELEMTFGKEDGKSRTTVTEVELNSTGRDIQEQGFLEAKSRYKKKCDEGYRENKDAIDEVVNVMLANKYKDDMIKKWPVAVQRKLNGVRARFTRENGLIKCYSRKNNEYPWLGHIKRELEELFKYLPPNNDLDGEIYNHDMTFEEITSAVKTKNFEHSDNKRLIYYIFDLIDPMMTYDVRYKTLQGAFSKYSSNNVKLLSVEYLNSHQEILQKHNEYVSEGYEGIIIRKIFNEGMNKRDKSSALYKFGRTNNILKYKEFIDEEGTIVDIEEAKGTEKGAADLVIVDKRGCKFPVRMKGSIDRRKDWFQHPEKVLNKPLTFRYFSRTSKGMPLFPVGVEIRDYE